MITGFLDALELGEGMKTQTNTLMMFKWPRRENNKTNEVALGKTLLRFFRQNLEPNFEAAWWWHGLSKQDRGS
jgi:hypothetical protein